MDVKEGLVQVESHGICDRGYMSQSQGCASCMGKKRGVTGQEMVPRRPCRAGVTVGHCPVPFLL